MGPVTDGTCHICVTFRLARRDAHGLSFPAASVGLCHVFLSGRFIRSVQHPWIWGVAHAEWLSAFEVDAAGVVRPGVSGNPVGAGGARDGRVDDGRDRVVAPCWRDATSAGTKRSTNSRSGRPR